MLIYLQGKERREEEGRKGSNEKDRRVEGMRKWGKDDGETVSE